MLTGGTALGRIMRGALRGLDRYMLTGGAMLGRVLHMRLRVGPHGDTSDRPFSLIQSIRFLRAWNISHTAPLLPRRRALLPYVVLSDGSKYIELVGEPQEEGMMSTPASLPSVMKPRLSNQ